MTLLGSSNFSNYGLKLGAPGRGCTLGHDYEAGAHWTPPKITRRREYNGTVLVQKKWAPGWGLEPQTTGLKVQRSNQTELLGQDGFRLYNVSNRGLVVVSVTSQSLVDGFLKRGFRVPIKGPRVVEWLDVSAPRGAAASVENHGAPDTGSPE